MNFDTNKFKKYSFFIVVIIFIIVFYFLNLDKNTKLPEDTTCKESIALQEDDLKNDNLYKKETFEKYKVEDLYTGLIANLDLSNKVARLYKTALSQAIKENGVNLAGHYFVVSVPMTGQGENYFIVDVKTGKVYSFPYEATFLDFQRDSSLIVMNSKEAIENYMVGVKDEVDKCISTGVVGLYYSDLRPVYFNWENGKLNLIGPENPLLIEDDFWKKS